MTTAAELSRLHRLVKRFVFRARRALAGAGAGSTLSRIKGRGLAFEELRAYQPGDDVRDISWQATARRGEPFVKRFTEERDRTIWLLVDDSPSMDFGDGAAPIGDPWRGRAKRRALLEAVAVLALAAAAHRDRVGMLTFGGRDCTTPARGGERHALRLLRDLAEAATSSAGLPLADAVPRLAGLARRRSLIVVASDFLDADSPRLLAPLARRHQLVALHIVDPWERELPSMGLVCLRDAESGRQVVVDSGSHRYRTAFAEAAREREQTLLRSMARWSIPCVVVPTDRPAAATLLRSWPG